MDRRVWSAVVIVLALLPTLLIVAGDSRSLPPAVYAIALRLGVSLLGPCDEPILLRTVAPLRNESFATLRTWHQCGACTQAQDVPAWSARLSLSDARDANALPHPSWNAESHRRCGVLVRQAEALKTRRAPHNATWWDARVGVKPLLISLARPLKPSQPLPQRGGCPLIKQMHVHQCATREVGRLTVDGLELRAMGSALGGARSALPSALVLPAHDPGRDRNIFHAVRLAGSGNSIWCVLQAAEQLRRAGAADLALVAPAAFWKSLGPFEVELLSLLVPRWRPSRRHDAAGSAHQFAMMFAMQPHVAGSPTAGPAYNYFELDRAPDPLLMALPAAVRAALRLWPPPPAERHVLVLQRLKMRSIAGVRTHGLGELLQALCSAGIAARVAAFESATLQEQVREMSSAAVLVSPHGAQLTNLMWLPPGATVVEVLLRPRRSAGCTCDRPSRPCECGFAYFKGDYANLAHAMGLRWMYLDPVRAYPRDCGRAENPLGCDLLLLDPAELRDVVWMLLHDAKRHASVHRIKHNRTTQHTRDSAHTAQ